MRKRAILVLAILVKAALGNSAVLADASGSSKGVYGSWYGGVGISFMSISSDETIYADGTEGAGIYLLGGYRFNSLFSLEVFYTGSLDNNMVSNVFGVGPRFTFLNLRETMVAPWLAVYLSGVSLEWKDDNVSTDSLSFSGSGGVDVKIGDSTFIEIALRYYPFSDDFKQGSTTFDEDVDTDIYEIGVSCIFHGW